MLQHLRDRHLDTGLHKVWIDNENNIATFPIWNLSGQLVGYQQYRPDKTKEANNHPKESRYFTYIKDKKVGVWGLESWNLSNTLFITEGIFDACRLSSHGFSSLAIFGYSLSDSARSWLWAVRGFRPVVVVCDSDNAGRRLNHYGHCNHVVEGYKDLGDASENYVKNLLKGYK